MQVIWSNVSRPTHLQKELNQINWTWWVSHAVCVNVRTCMRPQRKVICIATSTLAESTSIWLPSTPLLCNSTSAVTVPIIMAKKAKVPIKHKHTHRALTSNSVVRQILECPFPVVVQNQVGLLSIYNSEYNVFFGSHFFFRHQEFEQVGIFRIFLLGFMFTELYRTKKIKMNEESYPWRCVWKCQRWRRQATDKRRCRDQIPAKFPQAWHWPYLEKIIHTYLSVCIFLVGF